MTTKFVKGKVALVTGGASGIGFAIVRKLLENKAKGVAIVDISDEKRENVLGDLHDYIDKLIFIKADVTQEDEFRGAFEKTVDHFKNLDIVVNNAGIADEIQWQKTLAVNLGSVMMGTYLAMDEYLPKFKSSEEGLIVNTASVLGLNTFPNYPTYCATKHGVVGLGKALGDKNHYEETKVRVLTICPGVVATNIISTVAPKYKGWPSRTLEISKIISSCEYIGEEVIKIMNDGKNGSVWVLENEEPAFEVIFPNRAEMH